jgi:zinc and cadmium transporter
LTLASDADIWRGTLLSVGVVSAIPLVCLVFVARGRWVASVSQHLTGLAVGALLANACFELIPESIDRSGWRPAVLGYLLAGFAGFGVLERLIHFHGQQHVAGDARKVRPYVVLNLVGVTMHNAIDGMIIAASYAAGAGLGVATTIAVVLHEIPHEIGNFGVFVHGGVSPGRAVLLNLVSALAAILGAIVTLGIGLRNGPAAAALLPIAAGSLIYVAVVGLLPELIRDFGPKRLGPVFAMALLGAGVTLLPVLLVR